VLQDIPVLAIDQRLQEAKDGEPELVNVVTLEVDAEQSETLVFASHNGRLQLALRGPSDHEILKTAGISVGDLLGTRRPKRTYAATGPVTSVEVLKGSGRSVSTF
jgi:Flp pilus assembly protein CpaB